MNNINLKNNMKKQDNKHNISAMILAAGRGRRMQSLTDHTPKPLIEVNGKALIEHQIENLADTGISRIIINVAYLSELIVKRIGFGERWGITIRYLYEPLGAYDTGGGIIRALPWLSDPFIVVNADIISNYNFHSIVEHSKLMSELAHLVLVLNPVHNLKGDFCLTSDKKIIVINDNCQSYTYTGISVYKKALFKGIPVGSKISLPRIWQPFIKQKLISGELFHANWCDVGTPERWQEINRA